MSGAGEAVAKRAHTILARATAQSVTRYCNSKLDAVLDVTHTAVDCTAEGVPAQAIGVYPMWDAGARDVVPGLRPVSLAFKEWRWKD